MRPQKDEAKVEAIIFCPTEAKTYEAVAKATVSNVSCNI